MGLRLVFVPGWGFDARFWGPVVSRLEGFDDDLDCQVWDLGFRGHTDLGKLADGDGPTVAIGHSLGFAWLLANRPFAWSAARLAPSTQFGMTRRNEAVLRLVPWT